MIVLDSAGTRALSLINTQNGANVEVNFSDYTTTTGVYARGVPTLTTISSGTTTSICATPAASTIRDIDYVNIYNTYAGSQNFTVQITSGSGGPFVLIFATLAQNESLNYTHGSGWCAMDANGNRKEALGTILPSLTVTGNATIGGTLGVTGVATFTAQPIMSSLTASRPVFTDASKGLVSNTMTGTGDVVMSTSPTLSTSIVTGASFTFAAAATTLNIGNASGTNTILGATTFSQAATFSSDISVNGVSIGSYSLYDGAVFRVASGAGIGINRANATDNSYVYFGSGTSAGAQQDGFIGYIGAGGVNAMRIGIAGAGVVDVNASGMNGVLGATTPAAASVTTLTAATIATLTSVNSILNLGNAASNGSPVIRMLGSNSATNWEIGQQAHVTAGSIEFTPSTTAGGSTFTTPVITLTSTGINNTVIGATTPAALSATTGAYSGLLSANAGLAVTGAATVSTALTAGPAIASPVGALHTLYSDNSSDSNAVEIRQGRFNKTNLILSTNQTTSGYFLRVNENGSDVLTVGTGGGIASTKVNAFLTATPVTGTASVYQLFNNTGGPSYIGQNDSAGADLIGAAYSMTIQAASGRTVVQAISGTGAITTVSSTGLAVTGVGDFTGWITPGASAKAAIRLVSTGTYYGKIQNDAADEWSLAYGSANDDTLGTSVLKWTPSGVAVTGTLSATGIGGIGAATSATTNLNLAAGTTGVSTLRIPHGSAPSAPVDGDMWTTTAGLYIRINGGTVGPLS